MDPRRIIHLLSRTRDRINKDLQREIDALGVGRIAPAHGSVLYALRSGTLPMQELALLIERDNSTVTALVDKLEKLGYVRRQTDPEDLRSYLVSLTPQGRRVATRVVAASRRTVGRVYKGFTAREKSDLMGLLARVHSNMGG